MNWYVDVLKKYAVFSGRARRKEYWMFSLANGAIILLLTTVEAMLGSPDVLGILYTVATFIPNLAVTIRRLHDTDRSGWWVLVAFVPFLGVIIILVLMALEGTSGSNTYGEDPKA